MVLASRLSQKLDLLKDDEVGRIKNILRSMSLPVDSPELDISTFVDLMKKDKKNNNDRINFILLTASAIRWSKVLCQRRFRIF